MEIPDDLFENILVELERTAEKYLQHGEPERAQQVAHLSEKLLKCAEQHIADHDQDKVAS